MFDSELLSLVDVDVVLIDSRVILLSVDFRMEAVPADLVAALLAAVFASVAPLGEVLLALLGDFMLCAMRLILALTASEERKAGLGLTSGRGIIEPGEVFLGVGDGAAAALSVGCGEAANFSRRLPNWSSCSRAAGEPLILLTDSE